MAGARFPEVLYIHPSGHLNDLVIPTGAISCLNAVEVPKVGRYAFEVSDDEVRSARILAMDLHWSVGLPGFERLLRYVRALNPKAVIVVGGITAGHYQKALVERYPVDFVIRGDSEVAFMRLVNAILDGRSPEGIPNVYGLDLPDPPLCRMTREDFNRTDPLTVNWFPTFANVTDWQSAAFSQGRTIPVTRGCPFRCPPCYGSYAGVFGDGYIVRSPESVVERVRQAQALGVRHLRLIVGKPAPQVVSEMMQALAASGPYRFNGSVGFYLCTPPSEADLRALDETFDCQVDLSVVPPDEHVPPLSRVALAEEGGAWERVAKFVASSRRLHLDLWATDSPLFERLRRRFGVDRSRRVTVSLGAVWLVTRPVEGDEGTTLDSIRQAMEPLWTFFAARLLSPSLARLLRPFEFLDALAEDPRSLPDPGGALSRFFRLAMENWHCHYVPTLPGLAFCLLPVVAPQALVRQRHGTRFRGAMGVADRVVLCGDAREMRTLADYRGVVLEASIAWPSAANAVAIVPRPLGGGSLEPQWLETLLADGFVVIKTDRDLRNLIQEATARLTLRVQDISAALMDGSGDLICLGRADLGYYQVPRGSPRRQA